ncbi:pyridoxine/pyridoxamine 5'-phosphate oxidase [Mycolicibacterium brumae]|uniref:Pyridoxamine 5'-phosphate oxidase n=1 Tax=Mycolicibacterium brumae TaxID=85968 RepID=A0A2G5PH14_9MYCO|nr:pyridoxal 5'-phosphate synthase [Mycolicibacterium brumae]MCV7192363.1 pyridoxal 5'-phosphate synthase [Mycolicibacterium brumae]PIB77607.1 pyridoxamine 5'-phosphate oxidase [Mycolicibacterium brumae]RWA18645.1 hypothetical protein MBRU_05360 [Mycolicibacterium brumae DSM 44177]UWW10132.1 pyridoxal 5'-phosphate synthase [Mycolicibacterium brumae]
MEHTSWSDDDGGRAFLRALPVLAGEAPEFDIDQAPSDPATLFAQWLRQAVAAEVPEPHAMTLSTIDALGFPRARVLIVKSVDADGWHFAAVSASQKGADLSANPVAALTFHWPAVVRQVRVVGDIVDDGPAAAAADFRARPLESRAQALTLRQSTPMADPGEMDTEIDKARRKLADDPDLTPVEWLSYCVRPAEVEFWQGYPDRRHLRLSYRRADDGWDRIRLWP